MFYDNYEKLCEQKGEKPFALPLKLGAKSNSMVAQWKKGSTPRPEMLQKIADYLSVTTTELLYGESDTKEKDPAVSDEADDVTKELYSIWNTASEEERAMLLDMARVIKSRRKKD